MTDADRGAAEGAAAGTVGALPRSEVWTLVSSGVEHHDDGAQAVDGVVAGVLGFVRQRWLAATGTAVDAGIAITEPTSASFIADPFIAPRDYVGRGAPATRAGGGGVTSSG